MDKNNISEKDILVTGGAGFIGSHIAERLADTNRLRILDNLSSGTVSNVPDNAELYEGDVRDLETVKSATDGVDIIFHEAAVVSVSESIADPMQCHRVSVNGTLNVLEQARVNDARVVLASSAAIYGDPETVPVPECAQKDPNSPYGISKLTVDQYAQRYRELYGVETVSLRYFNVYGPGQVAGDYSGVISVFLDQSQRGEPLTVHGEGTQTRDFVHVSDVVQANLLAATTDHVGEAYNIGTGTRISIDELARTVRNVSDSPSNITHTEPRDGDIEHSGADITKARNQLGYRPTVELGDGLADMMNA